MDGRKSLVLSMSFLCASFGCMGGAGMGHRGTELAKSEIPAPANETGKKTPKPATCVAFGDFRASLASNKEIPKEQKQQLCLEARRAYQQALQIDGKYVPAHIALGRLYTFMGEHENALEAYDKAAKIQPKAAGLHLEMGMCLSRMKQWQPAIDKMRQAVNLEPENRHFATTLGYTLAYGGHFEESLALLTQISGKALGHYQVARVAYQMKQDTLSKQLLLVAIQEKPDLADAKRLLDQLNDGSQGNQGNQVETVKTASSTVN